MMLFLLCTKLLCFYLFFHTNQSRCMCVLSPNYKSAPGFDLLLYTLALNFLCGSLGGYLVFGNHGNRDGWWRTSLFQWLSCAGHEKVAGQPTSKTEELSQSEWYCLIIPEIFTYACHIRIIKTYFKFHSCMCTILFFRQWVIFTYTRERTF